MRKLKRDKVISIVNGKDLVGVYFADTDGSKALIECSPEKADKIIKIWNKVEKIKCGRCGKETDNWSGTPNFRICKDCFNELENQRGEYKMNKTILNRKAINGELSVEEVLSYNGKKVKDKEINKIYIVSGIYNVYEATVDLSGKNETREEVWLGELELI